MRANHAFIGDGKAVASSSGNEDMKITKRGYVMSHFTKNVTGSTRLGATISASSVMETSAYIKGDSLIIMVINSNSTSTTLNVAFNLPYVVKSCTRTLTTESLTCDKQNLEILEPTRTPKFPLAPSSINTYVFAIDSNPRPISNSTVIPDTLYTDVYTIEGVKIRSKVSPDKATEGLHKGIYIINGKKVII